MGEVHSKGNRFLGSVQDKYQFHDYFVNDVFGTYEVYVNKNTNLDRVSRKVFSSIEYDDLKQFINFNSQNYIQRYQHDHPCIYKIYAYEIKEGFIAGNSNQLTAFYENTFQSLHDEIGFRKLHLNSRLFDESQLWIILYSIVSACAVLQETNRYCGDIRPNTIFTTFEKGIRVFSSRTLPNKKLNYFLTLQENVPTLLPPELLQKLQTKLTNPGSYNKIKADVFSVAMTMVALATLEDVSVCFDYEKGEIKKDPFFQLVHEIEDNYSEEFITIIANMLQKDPDVRPDFQSLYNMLSPFDSDIRKENDFYLKQKVYKSELIMNQSAVSEDFNDRASMFSMTSSVAMTSLKFESKEEKNPFQLIAIPNQLEKELFLKPSQANIKAFAEKPFTVEFEIKLTFQNSRVLDIPVKNQRPSRNSSINSFKPERKLSQSPKRKNSPKQSNSFVQTLEKQMQESSQTDRYAPSPVYRNISNPALISDSPIRNPPQPPQTPYYYNSSFNSTIPNNIFTSTSLNNSIIGAPFNLSPYKSKSHQYPYY